MAVADQTIVEHSERPFRRWKGEHVRNRLIGKALHAHGVDPRGRTPLVLRRSNHRAAIKPELAPVLAEHLGFSEDFGSKERGFLSRFAAGPQVPKQARRQSGLSHGTQLCGRCVREKPCRSPGLAQCR